MEIWSPTGQGISPPNYTILNVCNNMFLTEFLLKKENMALLHFSSNIYSTGRVEKSVYLSTAQKTR